MVKKIISLIISSALVGGSCFLVFFVHKKYEASPWTRHGIVKADIVKIAPEVNGRVEKVNVSDNQEVKKGDLLFLIDSRPFLLKRDGAEVGLTKAWQDLDSLKAGVKIAKSRVKSAEAVFKDAAKNKKRNTFLYSKDSISQKAYDDSVTAFDMARSSLDAARASLLNARVRLGDEGENNIMVQSARIRLEQAELNLSYTEVRAPVDGRVVNVDINPGDYALAGKPVVAIVDKSSIHVMAAFKETQLESIKPGDRADIILMSKKGKILKGEVMSIGSAINPREYSSSDSMVPTIPAVFDWVRLAQRVPVEIKFKGVENNLKIIPGTTASVSILDFSDSL